VALPTTTPAFVQVTDLRKSLGGRAVLDGVSFQVERGQALVIMGPSGTGKTTLLRCLNGLDSFEGGSVRVGENQVGPELPAPSAGMAALRKQVGFLFQQWNLFAHLTVLQNVIEAPIHVAGLSRATAIAQARVLLDRVGIAARSDAYPQALSGGEQQRAAIARALAMNPAVLLLDEATSALDRARADELLALFTELRAGGLTLIAVAHDPRVAEALHARVAMLNQGRLVVGPEGGAQRSNS